MAFKFRFERIVQHRQRIIDERGRAVALAAQKVTLIQKRLADLERMIVLHQHQYLSPNGAAVDVNNWQARTEWVSHLGEQRNELNEFLDLANGELDNCQRLLQEAWQDKEVLERLREKQKTQWRAEQEKVERQELDEIGQIRSEIQRRAVRERKAELSAHER